MCAGSIVKQGSVKVKVKVKVGAKLNRFRMESNAGVLAYTTDSDHGLNSDSSRRTPFLPPHSSHNSALPTTLVATLTDTHTTHTHTANVEEGLFQKISCVVRLS